MPMTISEKILARAAGLASVAPGQYIRARADSIIVCDLGWSLVGPPIEKLRAKTVEPERVVVVFDHAVPAANQQSAELHRRWRAFCRDQGIAHLHDIGNHGISHVISVEKGYARPGTLQVSVDTHANTCGAVGCFATALGMDVISDMVIGTNWYCVPPSVRVHIKGELPRGVLVRDVTQIIMSDIGEDVASGRVIELVGPFIEQLPVSGRMTLCNWTRKVQAVTGIVNPDKKTLAYVGSRTTEPLDPLSSDADAVYEAERDYDVSTFEPVVAAPPDPLNTVSLSSLVGLRIDQAFIGSCAGGSLEDIRVAAETLRGRRVHQHVRMIVTPGSQETWAAAAEEGLLLILTEAGVTVTTATCGSCFGGQGVLADNEVCVSTSTENFGGRMGSPTAQIYLASPLVVAEAAIAGQFVTVHTDPRQ